MTTTLATGAGPRERPDPGRAEAAGGRPTARSARRLGRIGWRDGVFLALACAGVTRAAHAAGDPRILIERVHDGSLAALLTPTLVAGTSLPLILGISALSGPLLLRARWQISVLALGIAWHGLVGLALLQERTIGQSLEVVPAAVGWAGLITLALSLRFQRPPTEDPARSAEACAPAIDPAY